MLLNKNKYTPVPVIMYHSIGIPNKKWHWNYLTCPYDRFEDHLKWLEKKGFTTLFWQDVYDYIFNGKKIPEKSIMLTFDDGFLDNYIFAYPLLKKYNCKGTIFINPDFVDPSNNLRSMESLNSSENSLDLYSGFLNWNEMKEMEKSGLVDIQSHAMTHTYYPITNEIIDFRNPADAYIWLSWNENVDKKYMLQLNKPEFNKLGEPVYKLGKSLSNKRYFPDEQLSEFIVDYVRSHGSKLFFIKNNWKELLYKEVEEYKKSNQLNDKYETKEEWLERVTYELSKSKEVLENNLNKQINFLCWPSGSSTPEGVEISRNIGYLMTTAGRDITALKANIPNSPDYKIDRLVRLGPSGYWNGIEGFNSRCIYIDGSDFLLRVNKFRSIGLRKIYYKILHKLAMKKYKLRGLK